MECKCLCAPWVEEAALQRKKAMCTNGQIWRCRLAERPPCGGLSNFNYYLLDVIGLPMIESPETIRMRKVLRGSSWGPWQKSAVHSCRQQLSHFEAPLGARTSASFRSRCLDQTIEPVPAR